MRFSGPDIGGLYGRSARQQFRVLAQRTTNWGTHEFFVAACRRVQLTVAAGTFVLLGDNSTAYRVGAPLAWCPRRRGGKGRKSSALAGRRNCRLTSLNGHHRPRPGERVTSWTVAKVPIWVSREGEVEFHSVGPLWTLAVPRPVEGRRSPGYIPHHVAR